MRLCVCVCVCVCGSVRGSVCEQRTESDSGEQRERDTSNHKYGGACLWVCGSVSERDNERDRESGEGGRI